MNFLNITIIYLVVFYACFAILLSICTRNGQYEEENIDEADLQKMWKYFGNME